MLRSMTAYSRFTKEMTQGRWTIEIHSVNRKMLDLNIYLPREFLYLELDLRKWIAEYVQRGQITVRLHSNDGTLEKGVRHTLSLLKTLKAEWEGAARQLGYDPNKEISLQFLMHQMKEISHVEVEEQDLKEDLKDLLRKALEQFIVMKEKEGLLLAEEIDKRISLIQEALEKIITRSSNVTDHYLQKLKSRLQEALGSSEELQERLFREAALLAEKLDIAEECSRLGIHLQQLKALLESKEKSVGKTMDFLVQEINREINTMGSKSADSDITHLVVSMKSELEKIREQLQNVE